MQISTSFFGSTTASFRCIAGSTFYRDGTFESMFELRGQPRKVFDCRDGTLRESFRRGWFSGSHSEYIVIDALPNSSMIGAHFRPGGATPFLGLPTDEFRDRVALCGP